MEDSRLRPLKVFLRVYAVLSLILFSALMLGFVTRFPLIDEGGAWHWMSWDRVTDHVAPMLFSIYIVWSIFLLRAARDPLANKTFLDFTVWANVAHAISMVPHAVASPDYHVKFLTDIPWVLLPAAAITVLRPSRQTTDDSVGVTTAGLRSRS